MGWKRRGKSNTFFVKALLRKKPPSRCRCGGGGRMMDNLKADLKSAEVNNNFPHFTMMLLDSPVKSSLFSVITLSYPDTPC